MTIFSHGDKMNEVAVLIPSCDKYSDLWKPFFNLFWKFWPDCNFKVYLGSNYMRFYGDRVRTINVGKDISWSDGLLNAIESIEEKYIIFLLEDFFLRKRVNTAQVDYCIKILKKMNGGMLRLVPNPGPDITIENTDIGIISEKAPYRVSTQGAVWKKDVLSGLLNKGESAWEFELLGTKRSKILDCTFLGTTFPVLTYGNHVVERGKWFPKEARRFQKMNIGCDFAKREVMTPIQYYVWSLDRIFSNYLYRLPQKFKKTVRSAAYRIANRR